VEEDQLLAAVLQPGRGVGRNHDETVIAGFIAQDPETLRAQIAPVELQTLPHQVGDDRVVLLVPHDD